MAKTYSQLLDEIDAAIEKTLLAQRYDVRSTSVHRAKLDDLFESRERVLAAIQASRNGGSMSTLGRINPAR